MRAAIALGIVAMMIVNAAIIGVQVVNGDIPGRAGAAALAACALLCVGVFYLWGS